MWCLYVHLPGKKKPRRKKQTRESKTYGDEKIMNKLTVEPAPHIRSENTTRKIMLNVIIALFPSFGGSLIVFGPRAALLVGTCVFASVLFEYIFCKITARETATGDLSAVVTGILLAFNLPVTLPLYIAVIGCFVSIVVVKQMFGGIGQNFANPAIVGRIVLFLSFTSYMTSWVRPFYYKLEKITDAVTLATPLSDETGVIRPSLYNMFIGARGGSLGETCIAGLLIGFVYLLVMKIITPHTPLAFIGTVAVGSYLSCGGNLIETAYAVMGGGLVLGAVFMATDYSTTPLYPMGKIVFGVGCGIVTLVIRSFSSSMPEGVSFSILFMNILTPYIDRFTRPETFGSIKQNKKKETVK
jgi:electron transport complex protein RnfD